MEMKLNVCSKDGTEHGTIALDFINRIGLDGLSAYQSAVNAGFEGTESEWLDSLARPAEEAARKAEAVLGEMEQTLSLKADLEARSGYIPQEQTHPLHVVKGGASTSNGYFHSSDPIFSGKRDGTAEVLFTTGNNIDQRQCLLNNGADETSGLNISISGASLAVTVGGAVCLDNFSVKTGWTYHVAVTFSADKNAADVYINGLLHSSWSTGGVSRGRLTVGSDGEGNYFSGTIHSVRLWGSALSYDEYLVLWNWGRPAEYYPDLVASSHGCIAEYIAAGLLPRKWVNSIPGAADLGTAGSPEISRALPMDLNRITVDTGVFYTDIAAGVSQKAIATPNGYMVERVIIYNLGQEDLTAVTAYCAMRTYTYIRGATIATKNPVIHSSGTSAENGTGNVRLDGYSIRPSGNSIWINATGNGPDMGMKVKVVYRYVGLW